MVKVPENWAKINAHRKKSSKDKECNNVQLKGNFQKFSCDLKD